MANCTCFVCGIEYDYCEHCVIVKPNYNANRFCSKAHQDIFEILSKHGCGLTSEEETLASLADYDTTNLSKEIQAHINSLKPKKVKARKEVVLNEEPTQE